MSVRTIPYTGFSTTVISRIARRPSTCPTSSTFVVSRSIPSSASYATAQDIGGSHNDPSAHNVVSQGKTSTERRSPYPILPSLRRSAFSKPPHSPQYDPSRAPITSPSTNTLERPQLSSHLRELLSTFAGQTPHYATIHIHGKPYLVTAGDTIRLPFLMHGVAPGDILRLNRATLLGSREWTLQGGTIVGSASPAVRQTSSVGMSRTPESTLDASIVGKTEGLDPSLFDKSSADATNDTGRTAGVQKKGPIAYVDERIYRIRAVVLGTESEPLRIKEKKKQRNRRTKTVKSKHRFTILRIKELEVGSGDEVGFESVQEVA